jgi:hypothetical protein
MAVRTREHTQLRGYPPGLSRAPRSAELQLARSDSAAPGMPRALFPETRALHHDTTALAAEAVATDGASIVVELGLHPIRYNHFVVQRSHLGTRSPERTQQLLLSSDNPTCP